MKILIAEDTELNIYLLSHVLEEAGYTEVFIANTCVKAVLLFNEIIFDWIILDCMLLAGEPGFIDEILTTPRNAFGLDLMSYFRSKNKTVKIVLYTGARYDFIFQAVREQDAIFRECKLNCNSHYLIGQ